MPDLATHASSFAIPAVNTQLSISQVDSNNVSELRKLLSEPPEGWCWCVAWEVPTWNGWSARSAEENRSLRERLWSEGQYHAYIFRHDEEPVGCAGSAQRVHGRSWSNPEALLQAQRLKHSSASASGRTIVAMDCCMTYCLWSFSISMRKEFKNLLRFPSRMPQSMWMPAIFGMARFQCS